MARFNPVLFDTANPLYAGATVTIYTVNGSGQATTTLATIYDATTGAGTLANPQTLNSEGRFAAPVYLAEPVIMTISGPVTTHSTGIQAPSVRNRGTWATATLYAEGDIVRDGAAGANTGNTYLCEVRHTSGTWATDLTAVRWSILTDLSAQVSAAAASATAADSSALAAATAETNAELAETNAEAAQVAAESAAGAVAFPFTFDDATAMADPGAGEFRLNNAAVSSVTAIAIDDSTSDAADISAFIATWDDSTNTTKGHLVIRKRGAPTTFAVFAMTGLTDNAGWTELAVTHVTSNGTWTAADAAYIQYTRAGDKGADGAGTVVSVTAGDASVTVGGTVSDPTLAVATGGIATNKIADNALTADATGRAKMADGFVNGPKMAANAVTLDKLSRSGTAGQVLTSGGPGADPSYQTVAGAPDFLLLNAGVI
jgi:hypothetical protein